jgi:hypothetical protein
MKTILHFRNVGQRTLDLLAPPPMKSHFSIDGKVWWVDSVLYAVPSSTLGDMSVNVFLRAVGEVMAAELEAAWAEWSDNADCSKEKTEQGD